MYVFDMMLHFSTCEAEKPMYLFLALCIFLSTRFAAHSRWALAWHIWGAINNELHCKRCVHLCEC